MSLARPHPSPPSPSLYLASRSPRRAAFLRELGLDFAVVDVDVIEQPVAGQSPADYALSVALAKAAAGVAQLDDDARVLAADTDVSIDGAILGKPRDADDALRMLRRLSGRAHLVCSAVVLRQGARVESCVTTSHVHFATLDDAGARAYCATGEPLDKAGAYAIQGGAARWVRSIEGSYTGIVGLPLAETVALLARFGVACSFLSSGARP